MKLKFFIYTPIAFSYIKPSINNCTLSSNGTLSNLFFTYNLDSDLKISLSFLLQIIVYLVYYASHLFRPLRIKLTFINKIYGINTDDRSFTLSLCRSAL